MTKTLLSLLLQTQQTLSLKSPPLLSSRTPFQDLLLVAPSREQNYMGDSAKTISDSNLVKRIGEMRKALEDNRDAQFEANKDYIKDGIKRELLTAFVNDSVSTAFSLKRDKQLNEAIKYLKDEQLYKKLISAPPKQKKKAAKSKK